MELPSTRARLWAQIWADYFTEAWIGGENQGTHEGYLEPWAVLQADREPKAGYFALKEASATGVEAIALDEALRTLLPGTYTLVGEALEGPLLASRCEAQIKYTAPTVLQGEAW